MKENQKTTVVGEMSYDAMWAEFHKKHPAGRPAGDGWITSAQLAEARKCTYSAASTYARRCVNNGELEQALGTSESGKLTAFYRPIKKK
jgi:hypothetical protein